MNRPCPWRDRWRYFQPEPLFRWADSSLLHSLLSHGIRPSTLALGTSGPVREVVCDKDKYKVKYQNHFAYVIEAYEYNFWILFIKVTLNLKNFKPNEISVKLVDQSLVVCAEHEEKPDESGYIFRRIKRRYYLPPNVDFDNLKATRSDDGTLVICAQWKAIEAVGS
jgi:HSP20 family molecular chaperone IbpA